MPQMPQTEYQLYLSSPHWARVRSYYFRRRRRACEVCDRAKHVQLHHRSYENLGQETIDDLAALCGRCHLIVHAAQDWDADTHIDLRLAYLRLGATQFFQRYRATQPERRRAATKRVSRQLPKRLIRQFYSCPGCGVLPGERCRRTDGAKLKRVHPSRRQLAQKARTSS